MTDHHDPAEAEVTPDPGTIEILFEGDTYTVPADPNKVDIEALEAMERGQEIIFCSALLGAQQWAQLKARYRTAHGGAFPAEAIKPLGLAIGQAYGFKSAGE